MKRFPVQEQNEPYIFHIVQCHVWSIFPRAKSEHGRIQDLGGGGGGCVQKITCANAHYEREIQL